MSKTELRVTPAGGFDIPRPENWIAAMACRWLRRGKQNLPDYLAWTDAM